MTYFLLVLGIQSLSLVDPALKGSRVSLSKHKSVSNNLWATLKFPSRIYLRLNSFILKF